MSDQLTLDGLEVQDSPKSVEKKKSPKPTKSAKLDADLQARVQRLIDLKSEATLQTIQKPEQSLIETIQAQLANFSFDPTLRQTQITKTAVEVVQIPITEPLATPEALPEPEVLTVTDLNKNIKRLLEKSFPIIWVKGEISNFKIPSSGHMYFTLKDSGAQIKAVMFRGFAQSMKFKPEDGMEVLVRCKVTVYEPRGDYQLFCEVMEPVGYGALQVAFEKLKLKLQQEGLFEVARKKQIPSFPQKIAIITSPTGAAIRDMLNVLGRRFGGSLDITIIPTAVQGDKAPPEIATAVKMVSRMGLSRFDVLIVGRGGGSLEDLWAFNTEEVVRAVAECKVPTISAVGHEVDFTICDFVADLRAPTPSAAAELVVKNKADLAERVRLLNRQLVQQVNKKIQLAKNSTLGMAKRLVDPKRRLQDLMLRCDEWSDRLTKSMGRFITDSFTEIRFLTEKLGSPDSRLKSFRQKIEIYNEQIKSAVIQILQNSQNRFSKAGVLLNGLSPLAVLDRGYSIAKSKGGILKAAEQVKKGDQIEIKLSKGEIKAEVL